MVTQTTPEIERDFEVLTQKFVRRNQEHPKLRAQTLLDIDRVVARAKARNNEQLSAAAERWAADCTALMIGVQYAHEPYHGQFVPRRESPTQPLIHPVPNRPGYSQEIEQPSTVSANPEPAALTVLQPSTLEMADRQPFEIDVSPRMAQHIAGFAFGLGWEFQRVLFALQDLARARSGEKEITKQDYRELYEALPGRLEAPGSLVDLAVRVSEEFQGYLNRLFRMEEVRTFVLANIDRSKPNWQTELMEALLAKGYLSQQLFSFDKNSLLQSPHSAYYKLKQYWYSDLFFEVLQKMSDELSIGLTSQTLLQGERLLAEIGPVQNAKAALVSMLSQLLDELDVTTRNSEALQRVLEFNLGNAAVIELESGSAVRAYVTVEQKGDHVDAKLASLQFRHWVIEQILVRALKNADLLTAEYETGVVVSPRLEPEVAPPKPDGAELSPEIGTIDIIDFNIMDAFERIDKIVLSWVWPRNGSNTEPFDQQVGESLTVAYLTGLAENDDQYSLGRTVKNLYPDQPLAYGALANILVDRNIVLEILEAVRQEARFVNMTPHQLVKDQLFAVSVQGAVLQEAQSLGSVLREWGGTGKLTLPESVYAQIYREKGKLGLVNRRIAEILTVISNNKKNPDGAQDRLQNLRSNKIGMGIYHALPIGNSQVISTIPDYIGYLNLIDHLSKIANVDCLVPERVAPPVMLEALGA